METIVCGFHEFGCGGSADQRSPFDLWYWGQVRAIWRGVFLHSSLAQSSAELNRVHFYYFELAKFVYEGYWLFPLLIFVIWKVSWTYMRQRDPALTKKRLAWRMLKGTILVAAVGAVGLVVLTFVCLGIALPAVAEGVGKPLLIRKGRW